MERPRVVISFIRQQTTLKNTNTLLKSWKEGIFTVPQVKYKNNAKELIGTWATWRVPITLPFINFKKKNIYITGIKHF